MEKIVLKENEELISGRIIKTLKENKTQGWGLFMVETIEKEKIVIYMSKNIPKIYEDYDFVITKSNRGANNTYILNNYFKVQKKIDKEMELLQYLKKTPKVGFAAIDKINKKYTFKGFYKSIKENEIFNEDFADFLNQQQKENILVVYKENEEKILNLISDTEEIDNDLFFFELNKLQNLYLKLLEFHGKDVNFKIFYKSNNPYKLYLENQFPLKEIDIFALALGWSESSFERLEAYLNVLMIKLEDNNSTYIDKNEIISLLQNELNFAVTEPILNDFLDNLVKQGKLIAIDNLICRKEMYIKEEFISSTLLKISKRKIVTLEKIDENEISYLSDNQREAYYSFLNSNISIITGGPGTGKSNLIKHIYNTLKKEGYVYNEDFIVLAPTGRAAANISFKNGFTSRTIHSFLNIANDEEKINQSPKEYDNFKILIIDEFSMVNINVFYLLLSMCRKIKKIVLLGDVDQLPAIGPGNLLTDLINSNKFRTMYLKQNFRSESSEIIEYINFINCIGDFENESHNEQLVNFIKDEYKINDLNFKLSEFKNTIYTKFCDFYGNSLKQKNIEMYIFNDFLKDISTLFEEKVKIYGVENVVILCPIYKGSYGIDKINKIIQNKFNREGKEIFSYKIFDNEFIFKENDKVIQLVNKHEKNISNGDIGFIERIEKDNTSKEKELIVVRFETNGKKRYVSYTKDEFKTEVKLAYAITIHKFQGSEINCAIFVVHPDHSRMLTRKLVYTAASRAIKKLVIFTKYENIYSKIFLKEFLNNKKIITNLLWMLKE
ncbi:AAA family ATPase [Mycoplasmopsis cynos]|uniref:ATP-dependent DNA helicase n=1 Tax=Mycoplasmopsis cynos TaxID=171284 RepID=UPI002AFF46E9|nr:AAA family ATPase [Mycoplasmopsis cynos]WQQ16976.1 AAA family ATPase [Mycoplasmopsis cynos]